MQWVVDEVLISFDKPLLTVLALGFALIVIISVVTNAVRSWLILRLSSLLNMQMGVNLLRHLLRLPMNYFESRHIGDIVSRFGSLAQIRERITTGFVETLVDGVMSITVLIMMALYSLKLTAVVLCAIALYTIVRLALYRPLHQATEEMIQSSAKEQSKPLLHIIPAGSELIAELLLPTRSAGFIQVGNHTRLRFDAFPYQRFGFINSEITRID